MQSTWVRRISGRHGSDENYTGLSQEKQMVQLNKRNNNMREQFMELYKVDFMDTANYNLIVDTTHNTVDEILSMIISEL